MKRDYVEAQQTTAKKGSTTRQIANAGILARIEFMLPRMRNSEAQVAKSILAQPNSVIRLSIGAMAALSGVSQPTVARFCTAIGCAGYKDFKLKLIQTLATGIPFIHSDVTPMDSTAEVAAKIFDRHVAMLLQTRNQIDPQTLNQAIEALVKANRIEFYGLGNSGIAAMDAQHKFLQLGVPTAAYSDSHVHNIAATTLDAKSVVVAISWSGRTLDLLQSVELALERGAKVVAITAPGSPLAGIASVVLAADAGEDPDIYAPMTSRILHLALIDVLAVGVALARGPDLLDNLVHAKRILVAKRTSRNGGD